MSAAGTRRGHRSALIGTHIASAGSRGHGGSPRMTTHELDPELVGAAPMVTLFDKPPRERTLHLAEGYLDVAVDDLPPPPAVPRDAGRDLARLLEGLLGHLHGVEAQVTSLGRELATPDGITSERAVRLVMSSVAAIRTAISTISISADRVRGK
jgi:hypothetical protein